MVKLSWWTNIKISWKYKNINPKKMLLKNCLKMMFYLEISHLLLHSLFSSLFYTFKL